MQFSRSHCLEHEVILIESRNVLVIDVIIICDWFAPDCILSRVVCVSDIMSHDSYCNTCFTIGYIAFLTISNQWNTSCIFPIEFIRRFVRNGQEQAASCYCDIIEVFMRLSLLELHRITNGETLGSYMNYIGFLLGVWMWIVARC